MEHSSIFHDKGVFLFQCILIIQALIDKIKILLLIYLKLVII